MNIKTISWNKVSGYSQIIAIILFIGVFVLGFVLGRQYEMHAVINSLLRYNASTSQTQVNPKEVTFTCASNSLSAFFYKDKVVLTLSEKKSLTLPQVVSGSGARYANADETIVFWNKGNTATLTENAIATYKDCVVKPILQ